MVRVCFIWLDSLAAVSRSVADDNANQSNVESIDARLCALRIVKEEQMRYGGSLLLLVGHTNAVTTLAPTITPPPTSACRPTLAMTRRSIRANVTVTVEAANTPLADIDYVQDSSYELYEYETDVVTHYTCDEASEAGFSCAEFERQAYEACDGCACAGQAPRCEYWDRENVRCQKTYGDRFADKSWALAACDADPRCVAVTEVATASGRAADRLYDLCKHAPHRDPHDACGTGDFTNGDWGRATFVCGQLGGFKPMRSRAGHGIFAFLSCVSAVLGVAAAFVPACAPSVEPRRTAALSLALFGVLPCCVFTLIGFAILSDWYGPGKPGQGACNGELPIAGGVMTGLGALFLGLGACAYYMQGGFDEDQVRRGVVPHLHHLPPVVAAWEAAPAPLAPAVVEPGVELAQRPGVEAQIVQGTLVPDSFRR
jgi:hypothetical protein